jgi:hypothetical protein
MIVRFAAQSRQFLPARLTAVSVSADFQGAFFMKVFLQRWLCVAAFLPVGLMAAEPAPEAEQLAIAREAYVFLYPLITMDITRQVAVNSDPAESGIGAPPNQFNHIRTFPPAEMRQVVRPNFDTLYSSAWLDLTQGPLVISAPDTGKRYYLLPMLDMWTDVFAVPGTRTSGNKAQHFLVVLPGWKGRVPAGMTRIEAPTPHVWIIGRTQTNGPADYAAVHQVQDGFRITPLAAWGKKPVAQAWKRDTRVDVKTEPVRQVNALSLQEFFEYGARLMALHPPHAIDWPMMQRLQRIGLRPGHFDARRLDLQAAAGVPAQAVAEIKARRQSVAQNVNGWRMMTDGGVWGTAYFRRASTALGGLGANLPEDAMYPSTAQDAQGQPLTGEGRYVLRFEKDQLPPAGAFWSLTLYDTEGFQVANPLQRFALGDRDALKVGADGAIELYVQSTSPGADKESNWLPAPAQGPFTLTLRLYAPKPEVLSGQWAPPPVKRLP